MAIDAVPRRRVGAESLPWRIARVLGALSLLAVGIVHLQQYFELYSEIPTIGTLFVLNFVGATVVAVGLLAPLERLGRWGGAARSLLALAGIAQAATAFVFLFISERTPLFGFKEPGYDPSAIMASRVAEVATVVFLGAFLAGRFTTRR
jgi:amino acid transporter